MQIPGDNENESVPYDYCFRVVLLGDSGTGKSQLLKSLIELDMVTQNEISSSSSSSSSSSTIGVDFKSKIFNLDKSQVKVRLQFYDTSGSPNYRDICLSYLFCVQAYLIIYDVNSMPSFLNCQLWLDEISKSKYKAFYDLEENLIGRDNLIKILVGCKNDLAANEKTQKAVSTKKARDFARKNGFLLFFETSAKENSNIKELFDEICLELITNYLNYLNFKMEKFSLIVENTSLDKSLVLNSMSLSALTTKSKVFFDCQSESLNCNHLILNNLNLKRKNLQQKGNFLEFFYF